MTNEQAKDALLNYTCCCKYGTSPVNCSDEECYFGKAVKTVCNRPQGEWVCKGTEVGAFGIQYEIKQCNKCGFEHSLCIPRNFCPNCGSYMGGDENDNA